MIIRSYIPVFALFCALTACSSESAYADALPPGFKPSHTIFPDPPAKPVTPNELQILPKLDGRGSLPPIGSPAQMPVNIYEATPGSTGPGCCPDALAAVLGRIAVIEGIDLSMWAALLRGEQP
jgi:hypothetical protein